MQLNSPGSEVKRPAFPAVGGLVAAGVEDPGPGLDEAGDTFVLRTRIKMAKRTTTAYPW